MDRAQTALSTIVTSNIVDVLILGWLDAKFRKSNSERTKNEYKKTLDKFRQGLMQAGLDLDSQEKQELSQIALLAQAFAGGSQHLERTVKPATYNQRLAIISSFYEYAIKQVALEVNPIARIERGKVQSYASAVPLSADDVETKLASIDRDTLQGKRDYALLCVYLQTGRRLNEVAQLQLQHLTMQSEKLTVTFEHCKGGKTMIDTLPYSVSHALLEWLEAYYGETLTLGTADTRPVWIALAHDSRVTGNQLGTQSIADVFKKRLGTSKVHTSRHTYAHIMEESGAPVSTIQERLGHESLATTGRYLQALKRADNPYADKLAARLGIR
jgi:site-specific recombinase XerD